MRFCEKLVKFMQENEYSEQQLASTLDVTTLVIGKWEQGVSYPDKRTMERLCAVFKCEVKDLMDDPIAPPEEEIQGEMQEAVIDEPEDVNVTNETVQHVDKPKADSGKGALYFINKSYDMFCDMSNQQKIRCACEVVVSGIVILILGIILHRILYGFLDSMIGYAAIGKSITNIISSIFKIVLIIMGGIIWVQLFKIRYLGNFIIKEKEKTKTTTRDINQTMVGAFNILGKSVMVILKVFSVICAIPMVILFVALICVIVMVLYHVQYGILFLWVALLVLGINLIIYSLIELAYRFITAEVPEVMKLFTISMVGLVIIGIGTGLSIATYIGYDTISEFEEEAYLSETITIAMDNKLIFSKDDLFSYEYKVDNSMRDVQVEIKYINNVKSEMEYDDQSSQYKDYYPKQEFKVLDTYKLVLQDLKDHKIREYNTAKYTKIVVTTSQANYNKLQSNYESLDKTTNSSNTNSYNGVENRIEIEKPNR